VCQIRGAFPRPNPTYMTRCIPAFFLAYALLSPWNFLAQTAIGWPADAFGTCEEELDDLFQTPDVMLADGCSDVLVEYNDAFLPVDCDQEMVVDRTWTVTDCDSVYTHVQRLELRDDEAPRLINSDVSGHFFSNTFDWLPVLQDNCNAALEGGILLSDTLMLCCGVMSFNINLNIPDDCGNVFDTMYTVYLHDIEPYLACANPVEPSSLCGEGTVFDEGSGTCVPSEDCLPDASACGPNTEWDEALGLCVPVSLAASCYFDTNLDGNVGAPDLLNFLSAFGQSCDNQED